MSSPKTLRVCGDLKTRPKFVGSIGQLGKIANCQKLRGRTRRRTGQSEGGRSCGTHEAHALPGCVRAHPRTHALEYLQVRCARWPGCRAGGGVGIVSACDSNPRSRWPGSLPGNPCTQLILLTPIAVPVQWCAVQSIFESILEYLSIYLSIYLRMYLSICSWSLPCQRCL